MQPRKKYLQQEVDMCFYINPHNQKVKIANEDISCWKVLKRRKCAKSFRSPIHDHKVFKKNVDNKKVELLPIFYNGPKIASTIPWANGGIIICVIGIINQGYHSYSKRSIATKTWKTELRSDFDYIYKVAKFIIPKGTKYFYNPDYNEYVSETIILAEDL